MLPSLEAAISFKGAPGREVPDLPLPIPCPSIRAQTKITTIAYVKTKVTQDKATTTGERDEGRYFGITKAFVKRSGITCGGDGEGLIWGALFFGSSSNTNMGSYGYGTSRRGMRKNKRRRKILRGSTNRPRRRNRNRTMRSLPRRPTRHLFVVLLFLPSIRRITTYSRGKAFPRKGGNSGGRRAYRRNSKCQGEYVRGLMG